MKKTFPKKAKLIADGGFYQIVKIDNFSPKIMVPSTRRIKVNTPEVDYKEDWMFKLYFQFDRVYKGYAEYRQYDSIKIENIK